MCAVGKSLGVNDAAGLGRLWEHVRLNCTTAAFRVFGCNSQGEHVGLGAWVLFSISTGCSFAFIEGARLGREFVLKVRYSQFFLSFGVAVGFSPPDKLQRGAEPVLPCKGELWVLNLWVSRQKLRFVVQS